MTEGGITLLQRSSDDEDRTTARVPELGGGAAFLVTAGYERPGANTVTCGFPVTVFLIAVA
jgi:hypothetical protein